MPTKDEVARRLARAHYEVETGVTDIYRLTGSAETESNEREPIKLLEVNAATIPSGVVPLHFAPAPAAGIHYPSVIIEVTPGEFQQIRRHELPLPRNWQVGELFERPAAAAE